MPDIDGLFGGREVLHLDEGYEVLERPADRSDRTFGQELAPAPCYGHAVAPTLEDLLPTLHAIARDRTRATSLAELATQARRSPSHFQRTFTRLVGESPKRYDSRLRLEAGAMMLVCTDRSVLEIALEVGFESHEGFTRAFGRHFDASPRDFRTRHVDLSPAALDRHASIVRHVGPCIGLYRMSTTNLEPSDES